MIRGPGPVLCLFYCRNTPGSEEKDRQELEKRYGETVRLYPMPCAGRVEVSHLLMALEGFADMVYVLACPDGACQYLQGNRRAAKRVERARYLIRGIGLETGRMGIVFRPRGDKRTLEQHVGEIIGMIKGLPPSPLHGERRAGEEGDKK